MVNLSVVVQCDDGSYLNVGLVYRWFIDEDITNRSMPFTIMASVQGPQHPFKVFHRETRERAQTTLDDILRAATCTLPVTPTEYAPVDLTDDD